jgi:NAD(P)-dependent dehydrogenase (short-subunit alcohol dehydrogenase family)
MTEEQFGMERLRGAICLVTGAAQGIGRACAEAFAAEGAQVVAVDRQAATLEEVGRLPGILPEVLDVTDGAAIADCARRHDRVSVLLNCVGMVADGTILDCTDRDFENSLTINVGSMYRMIQAFLPAMIARHHGSIINIASVVSSVKGAPNRFAYGTSKAAVIGLTKSVARDFIADGIRCNAISPGTVASPSLDERMARQPDPATATADFLARQPMGRLGTASEIAAIATMLASDEARFMTGSNIIIDGGMTL